MGFLPSRKKLLKSLLLLVSTCVVLHILANQRRDPHPGTHDTEPELLSLTGSAPSNDESEARVVGARYDDQEALYPIGRLGNSSAAHQYLVNTSRAFLTHPTHRSPDSDGKQRVLFLVISAAGNRGRRDTIRRHWGRRQTVQQAAFSSVFVIGSPVSEALWSEWRQFGDLLLLDMHDSYDNLTLKTFTSLTWVYHSCPVDYVIKVDDDVLVRTWRLQEILTNTSLVSPSGFYGGMCLTNLKPHRKQDSKYFVDPSVYARADYPTICLGPHYLLSGDLLGRLLEAAGRVPFLWLEDVFLGLVMEELGIRPKQLNWYIGQTSSADFCKHTRFALGHLYFGKSPKKKPSVENELTKVTRNSKCSI